MKNKNSHRTRERIAMVFVTIVLCLGFITLNNNLEKQFRGVEIGYEDKSVLCLDKNTATRDLSDLLFYGNYIGNEKDANFIADHIITKLNNGEIIPNLGALNKQSFRVPVTLVDSLDCEGLKFRAEDSYTTLGITDAVIAMYAQKTSDSIDFRNGDYSIKTIVQETDPALQGMKKYLYKVLKKDKKNISGVLVRLKEHYYLSDTVKVGREVKIQYEAHDSILGYALTNKDGIVTFKGLRNVGYYSVLPVKKGFEYGTSQGTARGALNSDRVFLFSQREHQITPFDSQTYQRIKADNALTVRTLSQFKSSLIISLILFFIAWWSLVLLLRDRSLLLPVLMALSGIGLLMMFAINNPLTDLFLGYDMAIGAIVGVILLGVISQIDFSKFFNSQYQWFGWLRSIKKFKRHNFPEIRFDWVMQFLNWIAKPLVKPIAKVQGVGYLVLAFVLIGLLFVFGSGPEGSGVKVNLFIFQPSEIIKYLIILFLAAFFKNNAERIQSFSKVFDWKHIKAQIKTVAVMVLGLLILLGCYFVLGDMGPALVLAVTFVIIYSVVRRDLWQLLIGVLLFIALLFLGYQLDSSPVTLAGFAVLWLFLWLVYGLVKPRKQLFESAIFMNILISAFLFGAPLMNSVGLTHQAQRLQDRSDICLSGVWDNEVRGGDHVAQGLWSASSGGLTGQGLGGGNPNLTPASHTDMIFASIGEEMGWLGLLMIIFCMVMLIHRGLHIGYKSGNPFLFFLATGIAVVTGIQFLVITLGSTGLIPLTGVAVPFLSFGKTSLIINLAAFGILLSISKKQATELQAEDFVEKQYHRMVGVGSFAYWSISTVLLCFLFWTQVLARDSYLIRPAYVTNQQGDRMVMYNPRIQLLINNMDAGNIYDRNGIVLATNDKDTIQQQIATGKFDAINKDVYVKELTQRKRRYYPFNKHLFFLLGDYNTKLLWNIRDDDPRGYLAESRHLTALRGFDNLKYEENETIKKGILMSKRYKGSSFLNPVEKEYEYTDYDYTVLLPLLKDGITGSKVEAWNEKRRERDITLTVDAALQIQLQNEIENYVSNPEPYGLNKNYFKGKVWDKLRISVVILNSKNGDMLCSANYPLPVADSLKNKPYYSDRILSEKAYTDRDLGLTFQSPPGSTAKVISALAGLQQLGVDAAKMTYYINEKEVVETGIEPRNHNVTMEEAIVKSSNNYFINLVNDKNLYPQLDSIYSSVGLRLDKEFYKNGRLGSVALTPYYLYYESAGDEYKAEVTDMSNRGTSRYKNYMTRRNSDPRHPQYQRMNWNETAWAWGQGTLRATPLNMARIASIVANNGKFVPTQFILKGNNILNRQDSDTIEIVSIDAAGVLKGFMKKESDKHRGNGYTFPQGLELGGKTGTPERDLHYITTNRTGKEITAVKRMNDGWYIFFINSAKEGAPLAVAVRMERLGAGISGNAVRLTDKVVLKTLKGLGYL